MVLSGNAESKLMVKDTRQRYICCSYDLCTLLFATEKKRGESVACLFRLGDERTSYVHV